MCELVPPSLGPEFLELFLLIRPQGAFSVSGESQGPPKQNLHPALGGQVQMLSPQQSAPLQPPGPCCLAGMVAPTPSSSASGNRWGPPKDS